MERQVVVWIGLALAVAGALAGLAYATGVGMGVPMALDPMGGTAFVDTERHFRAELARPSVAIVDVIQEAQRQDYWIRIQTGTDITYLKGNRPCPTCQPEQEAQFFKPPQLFVDGQRFWVRLDEPDWRLNLRPSSAPSGYQLIVSPKLPKKDVTSQDLNRIRSVLGPFGVLPPSIDLEPFSPPMKPKPPQDARIDSVLYGLTLSPDWVDYARQNGIELSGLRAEVIVELASADVPLPQDLIVESRSDQLVRAQALIPKLIALARLSRVDFVRLPNRPQPAGP